MQHSPFHLHYLKRIQVFIILFLPVLLSGCSSSASHSSNSIDNILETDSSSAFSSINAEDTALDTDVSSVKETVTISCIQGETQEYLNSHIAELVTAFNQESSDYQLEIVSYASTNDLYLDLIRGAGPDLFDLERLDVSLLEQKSVLEDLAPYFEQSTIIKITDLLPCIYTAGTVNEKLVCIIPGFAISGFLTKVQNINADNRWTVDDYLTLAKQHPDALLEDHGSQDTYYTGILQTTLKGNSAKYIDWESKTCHFNSEDFILLLNQIASLPFPGWSASEIALAEYQKGGSFLDTMNKLFLEDQLLTYPFSCFSPLSYCSEMAKMPDDVVFIGFSGIEETPSLYNLDCITTLSFGINHRAASKEGAWAFMEFLLSPAYQKEQGYFSARQDVFEAQLAARLDMGPLNLEKDYLTEEDKQNLREIANHTVRMQTVLPTEIWTIIYEEVQPLWFGDKTAKEAADVIQSRVSLLLEE